MRTMLALVAGVAFGSMPTADWLARFGGVDLRRYGSGNPGANNALRLGGAKLGSAVLAVEVIKGAAVVTVARSLWGDPAALAAGIGAITGNVFNPWFRFRGGKGLGITAGVTLAAWPTVLPVAVTVIGLGLWFTRSTSVATIATLVAYLIAAVIWTTQELPVAWGVQTGSRLLWFASAAALLILPKQIRDLARPAPI